MPKLLKILLWLLLALALFKGGYHLVSQAWFFLNGAYAGDAQYYFTVGKGMLNGYKLYTDIFDTKPPAIYVLSAISFWLFDSGLLGFILNGLMVLTYPVVFVGAAWKLKQRDRMSLLLSGFFGVLLSLYSGYQAEAWQVEWFGAFFGILYVLAFVLRMNIASLTICMILTLAFKEPFVLTLVASAMVLSASRQEFIKRFLVPFGITAVVGVMLLLLFGIADGYAGTYLSSHFGHHLVRSVPLWMRGLRVEILLYFLWRYSYIFSVVLIVLFAHALISVRHAARPLLRVCVLMVALYLCVLAGNLRGYPVGNHFVAIVPFYTALFFLFLRNAETSAGKRLPLILMILTVLSLPMSDGFFAYQEVLAEKYESAHIQREAAKRIDAILDACNIDRYFFVEQRPYMEFMEHAPQNFFVYVGSESIVYHHPKIIEKHIDTFSQAKIVIAQGDTYEISRRPEEKLLSEMTFRYLANNFTITPWECAAGLDSPGGYSVLFRKDPGSMKPFPFTMK